MAGEEREGSKAARLLPFLLFIALAVPATLAVALIEPGSKASSLLPSCPLHSCTGLYCAGCGSTRAVHELLHGRAVQAMGYNPLTTLAAPFALYLVAAWGLYAIAGVKAPLPRLGGKAALALAALLAAFTVARNIPSGPCELLAPHDATAAIEKSTPEGVGR